MVLSIGGFAWSNIVVWLRFMEWFRFFTINRTEVSMNYVKAICYLTLGRHLTILIGIYRISPLLHVLLYYLFTNFCSSLLSIPYHFRTGESYQNKLFKTVYFNDALSR